MAIVGSMSDSGSSTSSEPSLSSESVQPTGCSDVSVPASASQVVRRRSRRRTKAERQRERRTMVIVGSVMAVIVVVTIVAGIAFTYWEQRRSSVDPTTVSLSVTGADGHKVAARPFQACALGSTECKEQETTRIAIPADGKATIDVPSMVSDTRWSLLTIYEDNSKNDEVVYQSKGKKSVTIQGSKDGSRLKVAEVHAVLVGGSSHGDHSSGDDDAYTMVWAISPTS